MLALVSCREAAPEPAATRSTGSAGPTALSEPRARAKAVAAATPTEETGEVQLDSLLGVWRVTGAAPDQSSAFAADDPRVVGALMDVLPEKLAWSYTPSKAFAPADLCLGPVSGLLADAGAAGEARSRLAPALERAAAGARRLSAPHAWLCGDGGDWADGAADFQVIGQGRMAMRWRGHVTLVLERIRRLSKRPVPMAPTGAFQGR